MMRASSKLYRHAEYLLYGMRVLFNKLIIIKVVFLLGCILLAFPFGCVTSDNAENDPVGREGIPLAPPSFPSVTFEHEMGSVGDAIRALGVQREGGVVLMSGLEERALPKVIFRHTPYQNVITQIADAIECDCLYTSSYYLILPAAYHALQNLQISEDLDVRYKSLSASVAFGAKTELYNAFSMLGASLDITIIADNMIAEARCGELFLANAPFPVILEAVLQSARIAPGTFVVESTPEYIFIRSLQNRGTESRVINSSTLTHEQKALLDEEVSLVLPDRKAAARNTLAAAPITLQEALLPLTVQLGVEIVVQKKLGDIPINPCRMSAVNLETALTLLLRQWPLPGFGFEVQEGRILIRERE